MVTSLLLQVIVFKTYFVWYDRLGVDTGVLNSLNIMLIIMFSFQQILETSHGLTFLLSVINDPSIILSEDIQMFIGNIAGSTNHQKAETLWKVLQLTVDALLDSSNSQAVSSSAKGIKQVRGALLCFMPIIRIFN